MGEERRRLRKEEIKGRFRIYKSSLQIMILHNCSFQRTNGFVALLNAIFGQASDDSYLTSLEQLLSKHRHGRSEACLALRLVVLVVLFLERLDGILMGIMRRRRFK
jgi:hypothetical protein